MNKGGRRGIILCGGVIEDDFVLNMINEFKPDSIIAVDKGLNFLDCHNIEPNVIVGDFDSVDKGIISRYKEKDRIQIYQHESMKEWSDTELAIKVAIDLKLEELLILGATGKRLDHFWANVQSLKLALDAGVCGTILDSRNRIRLLDGDFTLDKKESFGCYLSLFPLGGILTNITLEGVKYPMNNEELTPWNSRCVSNEIIDKMKISFEKGIIVLMETKD
jgi:thiamine pyrophosphokinase